MSDFHNSKRGAKKGKSKKQRQKDQFMQIYNVPNIKTGGKVLSGASGNTSSQISLGRQNKLKEKVQSIARNPMVVEGNIGHISIAKHYDEDEEDNHFYQRKVS